MSVQDPKRRQIHNRVLTTEPPPGYISRPKVTGRFAPQENLPPTLARALGLIESRPRDDNASLLGSLRRSPAETGINPLTRDVVAGLAAQHRNFVAVFRRLQNALEPFNIPISEFNDKSHREKAAFLRDYDRAIQETIAKMRSLRSTKPLVAAYIKWLEDTSRGLAALAANPHLTIGSPAPKGGETAPSREIKTCWKNLNAFWDVQDSLLGTKSKIGDTFSTLSLERRITVVEGLQKALAKLIDETGALAGTARADGDREILEAVREAAKTRLSTLSGLMHDEMRLRTRESAEVLSALTTALDQYTAQYATVHKIVQRYEHPLAALKREQGEIGRNIASEQKKLKAASVSNPTWKQRGQIARHKKNIARLLQTRIGIDKKIQELMPGFLAARAARERLGKAKRLLGSFLAAITARKETTRENGTTVSTPKEQGLGEEELAKAYCRFSRDLFRIFDVELGQAPKLTVPSLEFITARRRAINLIGMIFSSRGRWSTNGDIPAPVGLRDLANARGLGVGLDTYFALRRAGLHLDDLAKFDQGLDDPFEIVGRKALGKGATNTVYRVRWKKDGNVTTRVLKEEGNAAYGFGTAGAARLAGIGLASGAPGASARNLASALVAKKLGMEKTLPLPDVIVNRGRINLAMPEGRGKPMLDMVKEVRRSKKRENRLARELCKLEWLDCLTGQVDRHKNNYLVDIAPDGTLAVFAIDNDISFGVHNREPNLVLADSGKPESGLQNFTSHSPNEPTHRGRTTGTKQGLTYAPKFVRENGPGYRSRGYGIGYPALIDRTTYRVLTDENVTAESFFADIVKYLSKEELEAAKSRFNALRKHAKALADAGLVVDNWDTWKTEKPVVDPPGARRRGVPEGKIVAPAGTNARKFLLGCGSYSYFVRDVYEE